LSQKATVFLVNIAQQKNPSSQMQKAAGKPTAFM
jgi:hypothetical protein